MRITRLEYQKKDPNRVNIYVDENFVAGIDTNDIVRLGLYAGQEIPPSQLEQIKFESEIGKLFNSAINFLSFRPRSSWEIRQHLVRKILRLKKIKKLEQSDENQINTIVKKLTSIGQVNDETFAAWFNEQRKTFHPLGRRALKYQLLKKGVDRKTIDKVLNTPQDKENSPASELDLALKAVAKKAQIFIPKITDPKSKFEVKIKLQQHLLSRGFDYDTAKEAVDKILKTGYNSK